MFNPSLHMCVFTYLLKVHKESRTKPGGPSWGVILQLTSHNGESPLRPVTGSGEEDLPQMIIMTVHVRGGEDNPSDTPSV